MMSGENMKKDNSGVQSHIQMPKLLLKRFHNKYNHFCYYDVMNKYIGTNGSANSMNTEYGYYSLSTEHYLRDNIETPFGNILAYIERMDFNQDTFSISSNFNKITRDFIYALMARDPVMLQSMQDGSVFAQFLPARDQHDYAAVNGVAIARKSEMFSDYILTFMINRTGIPFVLPIGGLYNYALNGHSVINLPISPQIALCLVHNGYADRLIYDSGVVSMFSIELPDMIMRMNDFAFISQKQRNWGYVVSPERAELDRLIAIRSDVDLEI